MERMFMFDRDLLSLVTIIIADIALDYKYLTDLSEVENELPLYHFIKIRSPPLADQLNSPRFSQAIRHFLRQFFIER